MSTEVYSCTTQSECTSTVRTSPRIKPCHIFGVCKEVKNNLLLLDEDTIIFPSGNHCIRYHIHQKWIEFIYGVKGRKGIKALALSPDRRYLAVSEKGKWGTITIFDLEDRTCSKRQVLKGRDYAVHEFVCMAFSTDSKFLLGQAGGHLDPWTIYYWNWEKKELIASVKTTSTGCISQVSFNPHNEAEICVSGKAVFRTFKLKGVELKQTVSYSMEKENILCHTWMSANCIIAGTESGKLLMSKSKHLAKIKSPDVRETEKTNSSSSKAQVPSVTAITPYSKGFACSAGPGLVCLYEPSDEKDSYTKTVEIRIPVDPSSSHPPQVIATMGISPAEETLAISTDHGQLYRISLNSSKIIEKKNCEFKLLSHSLHSDSITGLSICATKPLIATCSKDRTMHIWNYKDKLLEQFQTFDEEPLCVSMHPNGLYILVGFATKVCLMKILHDRIHTVQSFQRSNCTVCVFNHDGNRFAAVSKNMIYITNVRTYETMELKGHPKKVQSVKWSNDDLRLVSCGMGGIVCIWNTLTGALDFENMTDCSYADVTFLPNTECVLAIDHTSLQEIHETRNVWEMATDVAYTAMSMIHSARTVFIGTSTGTVRVIECPFAKERPLIEYHAHSGPITKMVVTPCDRFLLTASKDGSLLIWAITDRWGKPLDTANAIDYTEEVLCSKAYLEDKNQTIIELKSQIEWMKQERDHTLNMKNMDYFEKTFSITQNYLQEIENMKTQIKELNKAKDDQKVSQKKVLTKLIEEHAEELKDMEKKHVDSMVECHEKQSELVKKMEMMKEEHKKQLQETENSLFHTMEQMKKSYEPMLQELQADLVKEVNDSEEKLKMCKERAESEIMQLSRDYELDLRVEKEARLKFQDELKAMEKNIQQYFKLKLEVGKQGHKIFKLEEEVRKLMDQLKDKEESIKNLTMEKDEQSKTICDQERNIKELQETIQSLQASCDEKQEQLTSINLQHKKEESDLKSDKERIRDELLEKEVLESRDVLNLDAKNNYSKIIADQKIKLKAQDRTLTTERQKITDLNNLVQRMKGDIHRCARFIQEPKKLKENFIQLYSRFEHKPDVTLGVVAEVKQEHTRNITHYQKILDTERKNQAKVIEAERDRCARLVRENGFLIYQLNEQREQIKGLMTRLQEHNMYCVNKPLAKLKHPRSQSLKNNLLGQLFGLQHSQYHDKLPPINTTHQRPDSHQEGV